MTATVTSIGDARCTECQARIPARNSSICTKCAEHEEFTDLEYDFALSAVLAHTERTGSALVRAAALCVQRNHGVERSRAMHPSSRGGA